MISYRCPVCNTPATVFIHDSKGDNFRKWDTNSRRMINAMAETGSYHMEGKGTGRTFLTMDDLIFLPVQVARLPLDDDATVNSEVVLGKTAKKPVVLKTPILNAAMSYGALSKEAKMALAKASSLAGTIANTGEGVECLMRKGRWPIF